MEKNNRLYEKYIESLGELFKYYQAPSEELVTFISSVLLVRDSATLLNGIYGTGKTQLIHLIRKLFFNTPDGNGSDFGYVACTQDLTPLDTLFYVDLARLVQGEEVATPRNIVTARFKFINEAQRAGTLVYNALLPLLSEKQVVYRDKVFTSPDYICLLDANPNDVGSSEIPQAFCDRIDYSFCLPKGTTEGFIKLQEAVTTEAGIHTGMLSELAEGGLTTDDMTELWDDVSRIPIPEEVRYLAALITSYLQRCRKTDRSVADSDYQLNCKMCEFRSEACSKLKEIPGTRFVLALLKLAQARAWLLQKSETYIDDVLFGLPYTLGHRLKVKADSRKMHRNMHEWVREVLYKGGLRHKIPRWRKMISYLKEHKERDSGVLMEFSSLDLAAADMINAFEQREYRKVY